METKRIQCPSCGIILDVRNSKNETIKIITCPQCKATLRLKFHANPVQSEPLDAETFLPQTQKSDTSSKVKVGETELAKTSAKAKSAFLIVGNREYKLSNGINAIGRRSPTSSATIQIATSDPYMSRRHAIITVTANDSGIAKAVITNDKNKNATTVDNQELLRDDKIVLTSGDEIVMGKTRLKYIEK